MFSAQKKNRCDFEIENLKIGNQLSQDSVEPPMLNSYSAKQLFRKQLILQYTSCLIVASDINVQVSKTWPKRSNLKETIQSYSRKKVLLKYTKNPWNVTGNELVTVLAHDFTKNGTHLKNFLGFYLDLNAYIVQSFLKIFEKQQAIHTLLICCKAITFWH